MGYFGCIETILKNGLTVQIRDADPADASALIYYLEQMTKDGEGQVLEYQEYSPTLEEELQWIHNSRLNPNEVLLVVIYNDQVIGLIEFRQEKRQRLKHTGSLGMGVIPEWRSSGVGSLLITSLLEWLELYTDIEIVQLALLANNNRALSLYQKCGFVLEGCRKNYIKINIGEYVDELIMAKVLK